MTRKDLRVQSFAEGHFVQALAYMALDHDIMALCNISQAPQEIQRATGNKSGSDHRLHQICAETPAFAPVINKLRGFLLALESV